MNRYLLIAMVSGFLEREGRISMQTLGEGISIESDRFDRCSSSSREPGRCR